MRCSFCLLVLFVRIGCCLDFSCCSFLHLSFFLLSARCLDVFEILLGNGVECLNGIQQFIWTGFCPVVASHERVSHEGHLLICGVWKVVLQACLHQIDLHDSTILSAPLSFLGNHKAFNFLQFCQLSLRQEAALAQGSWDQLFKRRCPLAFKQAASMLEPARCQNRRHHFERDMLPVRISSDAVVEDEAWKLPGTRARVQLE